MRRTELEDRQQHEQRAAVDRQNGRRLCVLQRFSELQLYCIAARLQLTQAPIAARCTLELCVLITAAVSSASLHLSRAATLHSIPGDGALTFTRGPIAEYGD